jgi:hypothetical protein
MAVECCGEHLYTAEEVRLHDETYHNDEKKPRAEPTEINGRWFVRYRTSGKERLIEAGPYSAYAQFVADAINAYDGDL